MTGVAEQRHLAVGPAVERFPVDDRPLVHVRADCQHLLHLPVEAGKRLAQLPDVALGRPGLDAEFRLRLAGDQIDLAAVRLPARIRANCLACS
jgi:hypothetical protein